ncbi:hypothetical protein CW357_03205 [Rummeliibacillus sp. TYF005]|nr:hypothetical protein CW357_03205 [Rummeliibacillus sp. TYF005]
MVYSLIWGFYSLLPSFYSLFFELYSPLQQFKSRISKHFSISVHFSSEQSIIKIIFTPLHNLLILNFLLFYNI